MGHVSCIGHTRRVEPLAQLLCSSVSGCCAASLQLAPALASLLPWDADSDILPAEPSCRPSNPCRARLPPAQLLPLQAPYGGHWPQLQVKQPLQSLSPEKRPAPLVSPFQGAAGGRAHSAYSTERHSGRAGPAAQAEAGLAPKPLTLEEVPEGRPGAGLEPACSSPSRVGMKLQHLKQRQQVGRGVMFHLQALQLPSHSCTAA